MYTYDEIRVILKESERVMFTLLGKPFLCRYFLNSHTSPTFDTFFQT